MLGRRISARQPPPTCLLELRRALLDGWCDIPQDQIDNLTFNMHKRLHVLDVNRGRTDNRNVLAVVVGKEDSNFYKLANENGSLKQLYTRNQFVICKEKLLSIDEIYFQEMSLREAAAANSRSGGQGYKRANSPSVLTLPVSVRERFSLNCLAHFPFFVVALWTTFPKSTNNAPAVSRIGNWLLKERISGTVWPFLTLWHRGPPTLL
ncbi:KRAB-A domain-containing protein 2 [Trichonephila clavipes]|nr:KRAB-A domain-containing protein 2 [Trichonephila clavipes]